MKTLERLAEDWLLATEIHKLEARLWRRVKRDRLQVVMLTSAVRGEGKTTTAAYLATALGLHPDRKILALDLDFRAPKLNSHLGLEGPDTLGEVLKGERPIKDVIIKTSLPNLDVVIPPARGEDPGLLRRASELTRALNYLKQNYDLILMDVPAIIPVADASGLLPFADGVLLVAMAGKTTRPLLNRAREMCLGMNANILGLIVGNLKEAAPEYVDSGYYYGYGYHQ